MKTGNSTTAAPAPTIRPTRIREMNGALSGTETGGKKMPKKAIAVAPSATSTVEAGRRLPDRPKVDCLNASAVIYARVEMDSESVMNPLAVRPG